MPPHGLQVIFTLHIAEGDSVPAALEHPVLVRVLLVRDLGVGEVVVAAVGLDAEAAGDGDDEVGLFVAHGCGWEWMMGWEMGGWTGYGRGTGLVMEG